MNIRILFNRKSAIGQLVWCLMALTGVTLVGCSGSSAEDKQAMAPVRPVKAMVVSAGASDDTRVFPGIVKAAREVELAFRVGGPLVEYGVHIGQHVEKGDVLARIDSRDFKVRVMGLTASLNGARANLKAMQKGARVEDIARLNAELDAVSSRLTDVRRDFVRQKNLLAENAASKSQYDKATTALDMAIAGREAVVQELKKAQKGARSEDVEATQERIKGLSAQLKAAENALFDTRLVAPFDGYINQTHLENHETVAPGRPVVSLLDFATIEVKTAVPEAIVIRRADISTITCTLDAFSGRPIQAKVKEIGRKTESANQSYPMTVTLQVPDQLPVESGMAASVQIVLSKSLRPVAGFFLPATAVFADSSGQACVWRIDAKTMRVTRIPVTIGDLRQDTVHITSGLDTGDQVATAGARFLQEGQEIRILHTPAKELS
jgi:RND family efflux transporter MFP subunit